MQTDKEKHFTAEQMDEINAEVAAALTEDGMVISRDPEPTKIFTPEEQAEKDASDEEDMMVISRNEDEFEPHCEVMKEIKAYMEAGVMEDAMEDSTDVRIEGAEKVEKIKDHVERWVKEEE